MHFPTVSAWSCVGRSGGVRKRSCESSAFLAGNQQHGLTVMTFPGTPDHESHDRFPLPRSLPRAGEGRFVSRIRDFHIKPASFATLAGRLSSTHLGAHPAAIISASPNIQAAENFPEQRMPCGSSPRLTHSLHTVLSVRFRDSEKRYPTYPQPHGKRPSTRRPFLPLRRNRKTTAPRVRADSAASWLRSDRRYAAAGRLLHH